MPTLYGIATAPAGSRFLGFPYNTDDHMVYSGWMRQAMDGRVLMDNRFTTDPQPGLTINLFFFALGLIAKLTGILVAVTLARVGLSILFVFILYRLVEALLEDQGARRLAVTLVVLGSGLGFAVWHAYGELLVRPGTEWIGALTGGRLPTDIRQPEGFVFPSMLTNALFMASLCLILFILLCVVRAKESSKPVVPGALAMLVLMNVHSYDALLITFILIGLLAAQIARRDLQRPWVLRTVVIALGALPSALWFLHVLRVDPVFQNRAETLTYAANFRPFVLGYLPLMALGIAGLLLRASTAEAKIRQRQFAGLALLGVLVIVLYAAAGAVPSNAYFLTLPAWVATYLVVLASIGLLAGEDVAFNVVLAWACVGLLAPYFPALFQRKLAMGLSIPWALRATQGLILATRRLDSSPRRLVTALCLLVLSGTSIRWLFGQLSSIRSDVSNTTVHPAFLDRDSAAIVDYLNANRSSRVVVLAMPGIPNPEMGTDSRTVVADSYLAPAMPDLNPILTGLTGVYTYAGHWSETPNYAARREELSRLFSPRLREPERQALLAQLGADYIVAPRPEAFPQLHVVDLATVGRTVVDGKRFRLIALR